MPYFDAEYDDTSTDRDKRYYWLPPSSSASSSLRLLRRVLGGEANGSSTYSDNDSNYAAEDGSYDNSGPIPIDYSVLSIGVLTLGLILFVEVCRHALDHKAHHRPFFKAVIQMLYSELATLGIVEFAVFLLIKYWKTFDKDRKEVFGDVHFAIFYTAIFNAFQSVLTAVVTTRASNRLWCKTEQLELEHYVEIREEYQRIKQLVNTMRNSATTATASATDQQKATTRFAKVISNIKISIRHPGIVQKYHNLRVQVRFHELRLHFLESNNLSLTLKVSEYLKRSEMAVLIHLVHISAFAWLLLTGGLNLLYFVLGMVGYATGNVGIVGTCMSMVFFANIILSVLVSLALLVKMNRIFQTIIKTNVSLEGPAYQTGMENQRNLFWWGSPHLVISMIQFMNFGYALSLAIVIMYWPYLTGPIEPYWYAVSIFICYGVFIYILGLVLPQYTLCTSLGYLTNKKELQETVAMHRLDEMGTQQRRRIIQIANQRKESMIVHGMTTVQDPILSKGPNSDCQKKTAASSADRLERRKTLLLADMVKAGTDTLRTQLPDASRENLLAREQRVQDRRYNRRKSLSEGVSVMRGMAPFGIVTPAHIGAEMSVQEIDKKTPLAPSRFTHKRIEPFSQLAGWQDIASQEDDDNYNQIPTGRKSSSRSGVIKGWQEIIPHDDDDDEVAAMRRCKDDSDAVRLLERDRQNKHNWADERLRAWKDSGGDPVTAESGSGQQDQKSGIITMAQPKEEFRDENNGPVRLTRSRHARKKSVSASAIIQSWQDFSVIDQQGGLTDNPKSIDDQRCISHHLAGLSSSHDLDDYQTTRSGKTIHVPAARGDRYDYPPIHSRNEVGIDFHKMRQAREYESDDTLKMKGITNVIDSVTIEGIDSFYIVSEKRSDKECDDDNDTVQTEKSTGELSDVDVVQTMRGIFPILHTEIVPWHTRLLGLLTPMALIHGVTSYIKGPAYRPMSHIFGTMVIFFFIGFRVEAMIAKTGVFFDPDSAWGSSLIFGFWSEASWLACFMILDVAILTLLPFAKCDSLGDHCLNVAAIMDILLSGMTMTLLFVAESRRCCYDEPDITPGKRELVLDYDFENECTCPIWGRRTYNGFGVIEPFTSLIALRLFRFQFAKVLVKHMDKRRNKDKEEADESTDADKDASIPPSHDAHHGRCGDVRNMHDTRTLLEHWERAITEFPDIVERYGQFSGELLRAMLGLHVEEVSSDVSTSLQSESNDSENANEKRKRVDAEKPDTWQSHIRLAGTRYRHLSAEAQGLIIAGSLGKPVKVMPNDDLNDRAAEMPTVNEDCENVDHNNKAMLELAEFEVDLHKISIERKAHYSFVAPFASLVRSMRRCDRKLVPFLTTWVAVDVVVTQFEIVYFEAVDDNSSDEEHLWHHTESCRSALQATKGGKGLRLCDVALGRKVVGHLDLTHVTEVHVEQDADVLSDTATLEKVALLFADKQDMASEYWYDSQTLQAGKHEYCRAVRWLTMHEERLKLTTDAGTLYLRYYADLACAEAERNNHLCHDIRVLKKEVAFQWAESIVRIVGPEQLFKQKLPHFGEGNDEELYDYLETNHFHEKELESAQKEMGDVFSDRQGIGDRVSDISRKMSLRFRRSQSFGEPSNFFSRSASFGAATIEQETPKRQSTMTLRRLLSLGLSERRELPTQQEINSHLNADAEPENPPKEICDDIQLKWLAMSSPSTNPVTATDADANPTASPKRNVSWGLQSSGSEIFSMRTSSSLLVNPLRTGSSSGTANEGTYGDTSAKENGID